MTIRAAGNRSNPSYRRGIDLAPQLMSHTNRRPLFRGYQRRAECRQTVRVSQTDRRVWLFWRSSLVRYSISIDRSRYVSKSASSRRPWFPCLGGETPSVLRTGV